MKNFQEPTDDEIRKILTDAPYFEWPTFNHMPLNCFDLTSAVFTFPGDISESRVHENSGEKSGYADYKVDIGDLNTCPKMDEVFNIELWNEESLVVPWFLGRMRWACLVNADDFVLSQGFFSVGVAVARFQNIEGANNLTDIEQLRSVLFHSLAPDMERGLFKPIKEDEIFVKKIYLRPWLIARSLDQLNNPTYRAVSPIDYQTAIFIPATLRNSWFLDEDVPDEIEQKHLASFWDFLGHINVTHNRDGDVETGTTIRQAPGQAEKIDDSFEW